MASGGEVTGLIDPACYYGHREVGLAMLGLFDHPPPPLRRCAGAGAGMGRAPAGLPPVPPDRSPAAVRGRLSHPARSRSAAAGARYDADLSFRSDWD
ncbi:MAG: fructosamine kinase family protein [Novosphingobium sp.]